MKITAAATGIAAVMLLSLAACAKQADGDEAEDFRPPTVQERADVAPRQQKRFERLDRNADGFLTSDEYPERRPERTAALDGNQDGKVSKAEFVEGAVARFDALDADKNGQVTPEERRARRGD